MRKFLPVILGLLSVVSTQARTFYAAVNGNSDNPGTKQKPWSIQYAFTIANPSDTIYIKAGNYGSVNLVVANSGTTFMGYTNNPGDLSAYNQPDSLNTYLATTNIYLLYPVLNGGDRGKSGIAITMNWLHNVTIKNLCIKNYERGLILVGINNTAENIIADGFGDIKMENHGQAMMIYGRKNTIRGSFILNAAAEGIAVRGDSNLVSQVKIYSNEAVNHGLTDYYVYISPDSNDTTAYYNRIEDCYAERIGPGKEVINQHGGHGFGISVIYSHKPCTTGSGYCYDAHKKNWQARYNTIYNCTTKGIEESVMLRGDGVQYNTIEKHTSLSYGSLTLIGSPQFNNFNQCHIKNTYYYNDSPATSTIYRLPAVSMLVSGYGDSTAQNISNVEQNSYPWNQKTGPSRNTFNNCLFENVASGIMLGSFFDFEYPKYHPDSLKPRNRVNIKRIESNHFVNCNFIGRADAVDILFEAMRGNGKNEMVNCIITGFQHFESRSFPANTTTIVVAKYGIIPTEFVYKNCLFYNNGFDVSQVNRSIIAPIGPAPLVQGFSNAVAGTFSGCQTKRAPGFVQPAAGDYHLTASSPCIDAGTTVLLNEDFEYNPRPVYNGYDIGAYEYVAPAAIPHIQPVTEVVIKGSISILPNPVLNELNIYISGVSRNQPMEIFTLSGKQVYRAPQLPERVNLAFLPPGIYFIKTTEAVARFVKQ
ncbi:MAG: T9SS type A sorting domain-containing protein [Dinghuibacter sp.]|nr:T9SS type A sorting domain-containing protein [Dinghuibacter sp.]